MSESTCACCQELMLDDASRECLIIGNSYILRVN